MKNFIDEVVGDLLSSKTDFSKTTFVFPNKRIGRFLLHVLGKNLDKPVFSPFVYSIGEFMEEISGLLTLDKTQSIFRFYEVYNELSPEVEREEFDVVYGWAQTLIGDFNEIDQYLIDSPIFFGYLSNIQELKHWSKDTEKTELVKNYLGFWHRLPGYHEAFVNKLLSENEGYPGLQYRIASQKIEQYLSNNQHQYVFVGFNALNPAEQKIIQTILNSNRGKIYWDIDKIFLDDPNHDASFFIRNYKTTWEIYTSGKNAFKWVGENYKTPKNIEIIGVPKNVGQAKKTGSILSDFSEEELKNTAIVLGEQSLAPALLNSLPENVLEANLTIGLPLSQTPPATFFDLLFKIHSSGSDRIYHKDILALIGHPVMTGIPRKYSLEIIRVIQNENLSFLPPDKIMALAPIQIGELFDLCFAHKNNPIAFLQDMSILAEKLKQPGKALQNEYLFHFNIFFKKLLELLKKPFVKNLHTLHQIYKNTIYTESIRFGGAPFEGLQLMGLLESRGMDFETVIITSVNEGILPPGKSDNSFIPYDLKKQYGLPTHKEKDAMYTYYFYRLLQRAKKVVLLYDCVPGDLNSGEKSRFLSQLNFGRQSAHDLTESILAPNIPSLKKRTRTIPKTGEVMEKLNDLAKAGFSPSALSLYLKNPLEFYNRYVLGVKQTDEVEETVAANTLGTVIHDTLENLYRGKEDKTYFLSEDKLARMLEEFPSEVVFQFRKKFSKDALASGKNLIILEIAKRYVHNFLKTEQDSLAKNNAIEILELEKEMKTKIEFPELDFPVYIKGKADRIDNFNGMRRIIDYKTGKVENSDLNISEWDDLAGDDKHAKAFQVLCYAYLYHRENPIQECQAGVIAFKKLNAGFLKFTQKTASNSREKEETITPETLLEFEKQLKKIIGEITDPEVPFVEKIE